MSKRTCTVPDCSKPPHARGYCSSHYRRWRLTGDPGPATFQRRIFGSNDERFWTRVNKTDTCWMWTGALLKSGGYGLFNLRGRSTIRAHVYAYENLVGPVPADRVLDHTCHKPACVNPEHLRPVTRKQNNENHNGKARSDNRTTGIRGVVRVGNRWGARVKGKYVGWFDTAAEAEEAAIEHRNLVFTHNDLDRR